jgi:hypothetical protein
MVSLVNEISRVKASFPSSAKNNAIRNCNYIVVDEGTALSLYPVQTNGILYWPKAFPIQECVQT